MIGNIKKEMPALPNELFQKYTSEYNLSIYDSKNLTENKDLSMLFESVITFTKHYKTAANIIMGVIKSYLNETSKEIPDLNLKAKFIAELTEMIEKDEINHSIVSQKIFPEMIKNCEKSPKEIAKEKNWIQEKDDDLLKEYVTASLQKHPDKVLAYKNGNKNLLGLFMGEAMRLSKGTANPKILHELIKKELEL
jgi:aspartyl-tRNA(Asn)/glutamyl-tRNA(Gln) amidotransferase subunit B